MNTAPDLRIPSPFGEFSSHTSEREGGFIPEAAEGVDGSSASLRCVPVLSPPQPSGQDCPCDTHGVRGSVLGWSLMAGGTRSTGGGCAAPFHHLSRRVGAVIPWRAEKSQELCEHQPFHCCRAALEPQSSSSQAWPWGARQT